MTKRAESVKDKGDGWRQKNNLRTGLFSNQLRSSLCI